MFIPSCPSLQITVQTTTYSPASLGAATEPPNELGTAYFDNYVVSQTPEPAGLALLGIACTLLLPRPRRRAV